MRAVLNCCWSVGGTGMRCHGAQSQSGYSWGFILCIVQDEASSSRKEHWQRVQDDSHGGPFSESLTWNLEQQVLSWAKKGGRCAISALWASDLAEESSLQNFYVIICEINIQEASDTAKWNGRYSKAGQGDFNMENFKSRGFFLSKNSVIGDPEFREKIFDNWVWSEQILLFTQKLLHLVNSVMCCWDR